MNSTIHPMYKGYCVQLKDGSFVDKNGLLYNVPIPDKNLINDLSWVTESILEPAKEHYADSDPKIVTVRIGFTIEDVKDD